MYFDIKEQISDILVLLHSWINEHAAMSLLWFTHMSDKQSEGLIVRFCAYLSFLRFRLWSHPSCLYKPLFVSHAFFCYSFSLAVSVTLCSVLHLLSIPHNHSSFFLSPLIFPLYPVALLDTLRHNAPLRWPSADTLLLVNLRRSFLRAADRYALLVLTANSHRCLSHCLQACDRKAPCICVSSEENMVPRVLSSARPNVERDPTSCCLHRIMLGESVHLYDDEIPKLLRMRSIMHHFFLHTALKSLKLLAYITGYFMQF